MSNPIESREPWWAPGTNGGFNQRCVSALTHPVTVIALATLLLNDVLFKALWPQAWITGKLSDLAWVIFALPLLAFLLSLCTRGNRIAARTAFITAYVGLPLLYAAFNTFEPVHYWILRGLSVASGGNAGAPLDATDSMVIPLGWGIAAWVWQRPALSPHALRMRWGLLVAGVAVLASIATSPPAVDLGITRVGVSEDGLIHASARYYDQYPSSNSTHQSADSGQTWAKGLAYQGSIIWGGQTAETPRGRYTIEGADITLIGADGRAEVVYSTAYLRKAGNVWTQEQSTTHLGDREVTTESRSIVYDERNGNVVVALGLQGVLVGTSNGRWTPYAVGKYTPTDFTFLRKTRLLLTNPSFLALVLGLALSITGAALVLSQRQREDHSLYMGSLFLGLGMLLGLGGLAIAAWVLAYILNESLTAILLGFSTSPESVFETAAIVSAIVAGAFFFLTPIAAGVAFGARKKPSRFQKRLLLGIVIISLLAASYALLAFPGSSPTGDPYEYTGLYILLAYVVMAQFGITSIAVSWRLLRYWPSVLLSLLGMVFLIVLAFMLWLHVGIPLALAKLSAIALTGFVGFRLSDYVKRRTGVANRQP